MDRVVASDEDEDAPTFGEDGNVTAEVTVTAEMKTEDLTGVAAAPVLEKKKGKKRKEMGSAEDSKDKKKVKAEVSEDAPTGEVTQEEVVAFITTNSVDMNALVAHFENRIR